MIEPSSRSELVSYPIRDIVQEAKLLERQGTKMVYLNIGDPAPFGFKPPQHIIDAAIDALRQGYTGYAPSEGDPELRATVAAFEKVAPEDVFITSGLSEGIDFLFQAMVDPKTSILLPTPTYPLYLTKERLNQGKVEFYGCDDNFEPDLDSMRKKITSHTRAILAINPNNPTGAVYSRKTIQGILDIAGEHKLPVISDDVYDQLVFDSEDETGSTKHETRNWGQGTENGKPTAGGSMPRMREMCKDVPVVCGNSISKNYLYPGARVGYLAFHGEGWAKVKDAMQRLCNQRLSVNWEMQRAYIAAIKGPHDHIRAFNAALRLRRDVLMKRVNEIDALHTAAPRGAFYAFIKIDKKVGKAWKTDLEFVRGLLKCGVVVVPGSGFAPELKERSFRIVFLPKPEQINEAFDRIERYMKGQMK